MGDWFNSRCQPGSIDDFPLVEADVTVDATLVAFYDDPPLCRMTAGEAAALAGEVPYNSGPM